MKAIIDKELEHIVCSNGERYPKKHGYYIALRIGDEIFLGIDSWNHKIGFYEINKNKKRIYTKKDGCLYHYPTKFCYPDFHTKYNLNKELQKKYLKKEALNKLINFLDFKFNMNNKEKWKKLTDLESKNLKLEKIINVKIKFKKFFKKRYKDCLQTLRVFQTMIVIIGLIVLIFNIAINK